jgi:hypothetical protein
MLNTYANASRDLTRLKPSKKWKQYKEPADIRHLEKIIQVMDTQWHGYFVHINEDF